MHVGEGESPVCATASSQAITVVGKSRIGLFRNAAQRSLYLLTLHMMADPEEGCGQNPFALCSPGPSLLDLSL